MEALDKEVENLREEVAGLHQVLAELWDRFHEKTKELAFANERIDKQAKELDFAQERLQLLPQLWERMDEQAKELKIVKKRLDRMIKGVETSDDSSPESDAWARSLLKSTCMFGELCSPLYIECMYQSLFALV